MAIVRWIASAIVLSSPALAQDADAPPAALTTLQKACQKMAWLQGLEFESTEAQDTSFGRQLGGVLGNSEIEVSARWTPETALLDIGDDAEVVVHRGRQIARDDDHEWVLRRDRLANGNDLPFVFDPSLFFDVMVRIPARELEVARDVTQADGENQVRIVTVTIDGDTAHELVRTGALPGAQAGGASIVRIAGGLGGRMPDPDVLTDIAFTIDPVSHLVKQIRTKSYQEAGFGGNVLVQINGGGLAAQQDDDEVEERDEHGNRRFEKDLPVRKADQNGSVLTFTVRFSQHDMPIVPQLDETARRLLRMQ